MALQRRKALSRKEKGKPRGHASAGAGRPHLSEFHPHPTRLASLTLQELAPFARQYQLSRRETQVVLSTVQDKPRKTMACQLRLRPGTIDKVCDRLHKKLRVEDRLQVALLVFAFLEAKRRGE